MKKALCIKGFEHVLLSSGKSIYINKGDVLNADMDEDGNGTVETNEYVVCDIDSNVHKEYFEIVD